MSFQTVNPNGAPGAYHDIEMQEATRSDMEAALCTIQFQDSHYIANLLKQTVRGVERKLCRLLELGRVERVKTPGSRGGFRYLWRKVNNEGPLYDPTPGFDIGALAECFGGYTFFKGASLGISQ